MQISLSICKLKERNHMADRVIAQLTTSVIGDEASVLSSPQVLLLLFFAVFFWNGL